MTTHHTIFEQTNPHEDTTGRIQEIDRALINAAAFATEGDMEASRFYVRQAEILCGGDPYLAQIAEVSALILLANRIAGKITVY